MKILVTLPDIAYYNWQALVQINNLIKFGFANDIIYVIGKNGKLSNQLKTVLENTPVDYYVYDDTRKNAHYPSSLRPHILEKFFIENEKMSEETFLYIDPDLLFSKKFSLNQQLSNDVWYVSDTKSYIASPYIKSKSKELLEIMSKIVGIDKTIIEKNDENAGGAQYLMKNIDAKFWKKVYDDSEELYGFMKRTEKIYSPNHPIQSWTADMWAVLWNAWYFGHKTKIIKKFDFSWATDNMENYETKNFFHNAGVFNQKNLFNKTHYQKSPFKSNFSHVSKDFCSYKYVEEIEETKNNYPDLIKLF